MRSARRESVAKAPVPSAAREELGVQSAENREKDFFRRMREAKEAAEAEGAEKEKKKLAKMSAEERKE